MLIFKYVKKDYEGIINKNYFSLKLTYDITSMRNKVIYSLYIKDWKNFSKS